ncbi:isochorismate lyase [Pseudomonas wadenswilerensis]
MLQPKTPEDCTSLADIRDGIDFHDRQIFEALQKRLGYVRQAVRFKASEQAIPAPERVAAMLGERLEWAAAAGFDPAFIETLYEQIIQWNIQQQIVHWRSIHGQR